MQKKFERFHHWRHPEFYQMIAIMSLFIVCMPVWAFDPPPQEKKFTPIVLSTTDSIQKKQLNKIQDLKTKNPSKDFGLNMTKTTKMNQALIKNISMGHSTVCLGQELEISVNAEHPERPEDWVDVTINGYPGNRRFFHFTGTPGPRRILVVASTRDGLIQSRSLSVTVSDFPQMLFHKITTRFNPYHPYTIDFTIQNSDELGAAGNEFIWDFGDGKTETNTVPYISHNYEESQDGSTPYSTFLVTVQDPAGQLRTRLMVTLQDTYLEDKERGLVFPRVETSGVLDDLGRFQRGTFDIQNLENVPLIFTRAIAEYQYCDPNRRSTYVEVNPQNIIYQAGLEQQPLVSNTREITLGRELNNPIASKGRLSNVLKQEITGQTESSQTQSSLNLNITIGNQSDGQETGSSNTTSTSSTSSTVVVTPPAGTDFTIPFNPDGNTQTSISITVQPAIVPANQSHKGYITIDKSLIPSDVCGLAFHLIGTTPSNKKTYASLYYETKLNPYLTTPLTDQSLSDFLKELADRGLVPNENQITQEELYQLEQEGKVRRTQNGWEVI
ncbi:MAG: PKD domain-containing protein [Candidatus Scalindua sp.]|nr:PKD domain-containing protein [Candidatus Scalindua sp.]